MVKPMHMLLDYKLLDYYFPMLACVDFKLI